MYPSVKVFLNKAQIFKKTRLKTLWGLWEGLYLLWFFHQLFMIGNLKHVNKNKFILLTCHHSNRTQCRKGFRIQISGDQKLTFKFGIFASKLKTKDRILTQKQINFLFVLQETDHSSCLFISSELWWCYLQKCFCLHSHSIGLSLLLCTQIHYWCHLLHPSLYSVW